MLYIVICNWLVIALQISPDSKVHGENMGPTCVMSAPGGPHVGPMNPAIWVMFMDICHIDNYIFEWLPVALLLLVNASSSWVLYGSEVAASGDGIVL